jgi:SAM-dependent methyltransferase
MRETVHREAWDRSAGAYVTFASRTCLYVELAEALVRMAEITPGMTVVDLACGTGVVTEAMLRRWPGLDVRIIATDFSSQMIAAAREHITAPNVTFHCEQAEHLSRVTAAPVDRVVCSAAFWQFDQGRVLAEVDAVLTPGGRCVISLPGGFGAPEPFEALYQSNKLLWMVLEELALRGYDPRRVVGRPPRPSATPAPSPGMLDTLPGGSLRVDRAETISIAANPSDYLDFLAIPVMARRFAAAAAVAEGELLDILAVVRHQLASVDISVPPQTWNVVVLRKGES